MHAKSKRLAIQCKAILHKTGLRCRSYAILGGVVYLHHGGSTPQVKEAARKRFLELVAPALSKLEEILNDKKTPFATQLATIKEVLDRSGFRVPDVLEISQKQDELDFSKLTDEELVTFKALCLKCKRGGSEPEPEAEKDYHLLPETLADVAVEKERIRLAVERAEQAAEQEKEVAEEQEEPATASVA